MQGRYINLNPNFLEERAEALYEIYKSCKVCPHHCEVDRTDGQFGFCQQTDRLTVSSCVQHFGEEIPFTGSRGVGNIFVTSCNMRCDYCQNFEISQNRLGTEQSYETVAEAMLDLQGNGVHFIGWVSPSHVVPGLVKSLAYARRKGLTLPIIYNTNAFDSVATLKLLDGIVDVYLPDLKYSKDDVAREYSHIKNYVDHSRDALLEMYRQVGPLRLNEDKMAEGGLLVRHLVLPEGLAGTWETLCFIALELSPKVPISLMSQYRPVHKALDKFPISRMITSEEYAQALRFAEDLGFETIYCQEMNDALHNLPDFGKDENPFPMKRPHNESMADGPGL